MGGALPETTERSGAGGRSSSANGRHMYSVMTAATNSQSGVRMAKGRPGEPGRRATSAIAIQKNAMVRRA